MFAKVDDFLKLTIKSINSNRIMATNAPDAKKKCHEWEVAIEKQPSAKIPITEAASIRRLAALSNFGNGHQNSMYQIDPRKA
jgi:hypothetical protein